MESCFPCSLEHDGLWSASGNAWTFLACQMNRNTSSFVIPMLRASIIRLIQSSTRTLWGPANILTKIYAQIGLAFFLTLGPPTVTLDHRSFNFLFFQQSKSIERRVLPKIELYSPKKLICSHPRGEMWFKVSSS